MQSIAMDDNPIDKVVTLCIAAGIGAIMVCSFVLPVFNDMLGSINSTNMENVSSGDLDTWKTLLGVVVLLVIVAFMVALIRNITSRSR